MAREPLRHPRVVRRHGSILVHPDCLGIGGMISKLSFPVFWTKVVRKTLVRERRGEHGKVEGEEENRGSGRKEEEERAVG